MKFSLPFIKLTIATLWLVTGAATAADLSIVNSGGNLNGRKIPLGDPGSDRESRIRPVVGTRGMVVSDDRIASEWGAEILRRGGNAIDAAVATAFMLSVTRPYFGSLGGGGFLVYCPAPKRIPGTMKTERQNCKTIDYREKAPRAATRDMYVHNGVADTERSQNGALASGIPGVPAGLLTALQRFGRRSREEVLREPIRVAESGFRVTGLAETGAIERWANLNLEARKTLGCPSHSVTSSGAPGREDARVRPCSAGTLLRQPDLARVLREISSRGMNGFYRGWVAQKLVQGIRDGGGIFTLEDLYDYRAQLREPVTGEFAGFEIVSMPPPSSGGALLIQMLNYVERARKQGAFDGGFGEVAAIHAMGHAMALAYADRAKYFGDPDLFHVHLAELLSPEYLDRRWSTFDLTHARIPEGPGALPHEGNQTTHFSVIDARGNAVSVTTTINDEYGSGFVPPGTGIFMNNEMDDFSAQPGVPNLFGLVGAEANSIAPLKRPLSSMTPTIVRDHDGYPRIVIGGEGGPRISTAVFNVLVDRLVYGMSLPDAMASPRIHEQWKPGELIVERYGFSGETRSNLEKMGYTIQETPTLAILHAIEYFRNGRAWGVADPRGEGSAIAE